MNALRVCRAMLLAGAALTAFPAMQARAQAAAAHEVRKGDTLFGVARKAKYDGLTRNQIIVAIYRANVNAFPGGNINLLEVGTVLVIPAREEIAKLEPSDADRQLRELLGVKPPPVTPPLAAVKPAPAATMPAKPAAMAPLTAEAAAKRYREGLALERKGDHHGALAAYLEAGESGNGLSQRKLGQIYDKGNSAVQRDYQASLKWYQKAREQGVEIDKPLQRTTPR